MATEVVNSVPVEVGLLQKVRDLLQDNPQGLTIPEIFDGVKGPKTEIMEVAYAVWDQIDPDYDSAIEFGEDRLFRLKPNSTQRESKSQ